MTPIPFFQVDAFAETPFTGNPAAVMPLQEWLPEAVMQAIAAENNLAETAFTVPSEAETHDYDLRWFTPTVEVNLCGHATLAAAHILLHGKQVRFATKSGILTVTPRRGFAEARHAGRAGRAGRTARAGESARRRRADLPQPRGQWQHRRPARQ